MTKKTKKFHPISDMVVVKRIEVSDKTEGGVLMPDISKGKANEGFVMAVGPGRMLDSGVRCKPQVKVDDRVVFGAYSGSETKIDNVEYTLLREDDIFSIVEDVEAEATAEG